ncbi:MAG: hypothetical protein M3041_05685 [Acidobacteriota bacterium]|nr:hypothetical protein [Acidobacteriota bacterium]
MCCAILAVLISVIYRNSALADQIKWSPDNTAGAPDIVRTFLRSEYDLLCLARVTSSSVSDLELFLKNSANAPLSIERSAANELHVFADKAGESLLITGKTAEVLSAYIDSDPVRTEDRADMTLRRVLIN